VEPEKMTFAGQLLDKHIPIAMNACTTIEELFRPVGLQKIGLIALLPE
jgi:hypothetical protein